MTAMVKRNLLIFFRDKGAVFFSLLAVFIEATMAETTLFALSSMRGRAPTPG